MRKDRILALADAVEKESLVLRDAPVRFDMNHEMRPASDGCGSAGCIAGMSAVMFRPGMVERWGVEGDAAEAMVEDLGITYRQAADIYWGPDGASGVHVSKEHAARMLRTLVETGEVRW